MKNSNTPLGDRVPKVVVHYLTTNAPEVLIAYLFGSRASADFQDAGDKSRDWDFGLFLQPDIPEVEREFTKYTLQAKLTSLLGTDKVDVVLLNAPKSIELAHAVIADGICLLDRHPDRDALERRISHEYQDHKAALIRNGFANPQK